MELLNMGLHLEGGRGGNTPLWGRKTSVRRETSPGEVEGGVESQCSPPPPHLLLYQTLVLYSFSKSESSATSVDMVQVVFFLFFFCYSYVDVNYLKCAQRWSSAIAMVSHYACAL